MPERFEEDAYVEEEVVVQTTAPEGGEESYGPSTVIAALDQISVLVERARAVPLSANIVLNRAEIEDLVQQARDTLPEDLVAADAVVADAEAVLSRADFAADAAVTEANMKARSLLEEARERADSIMAESRGEAERMVERAEEDAAHTAQRARQEAESVLADARAEAEALIAADAITAQASARAQETVAAASAEAIRLRRGADDYVSNALSQVSDLLQQMLGRTDAGLRAVAERQGAQTDINIDGK